MVHLSTKYWFEYSWVRFLCLGKEISQKYLPLNIVYLYVQFMIHVIGTQARKSPNDISFNCIYKVMGVHAATSWQGSNNAV